MVDKERGDTDEQSFGECSDGADRRKEGFFPRTIGGFRLVWKSWSFSLSKAEPAGVNDEESNSIRAIPPSIPPPSVLNPDIRDDRVGVRFVSPFKAFDT
jgi:hypothetical protein